MKLHLPTFLLATIVAASCALPLAAEEATKTVNSSTDISCAGTVYTLANSTDNNVITSTVYETTLEAADGETPARWVVSTTGISTGSNKWQELYYNGDYNTLRITSKVTYGYKFDKLTLGGLIVEANVDGASFTPPSTNGARDITFGKSDLTADSYFGSSFTIDTRNTSNVTGSPLTVNGTQNWYIADDKTVTLNIAGAIVNNGTWNIDGGTLAVNRTITNSGTLSASGTTVSVDTLFRLENTGATYSNGENGYLTGGTFTVIKNNGANASADGFSQLVLDGTTFNIDENYTVSVKAGDVSGYYVNTAVTYSAMDESKDTNIIMKGGTLTLDKALGAGATISTDNSAAGTINIADGIRLDNSSVLVDETKSSLTGGSKAVYNMGVASMNGRGNSANNETKLNVAIVEGWQGTVVFEEGSSFQDYNFNLNDYGVAGSTIQFNGVASGSYLQNSNATYAANIELKGAGFSIENGFSGKAYIFTGAFSGDGTFALNKGGMDGQSYTFSGDMSQWTGELKQDATASSGYNYTYTFNENATNIANKVTVAAGTMVVNVNNSEAVTMTGDVTATGGTMQLTKTGDSKLTVNNIAANGGNVQLTGTGDNAITVGNMSIKAGNTVTGAADVTVTGTLTVSAESQLALTGALTIGDNATIDLTGLTINDEQTSYTLATATDGVSLQNYTITGLDLTGTAYEGWSYSISAMNPNEVAGIALLAEGGNTNTALVLTLTQATQPDTLTSMNVTGVDVSNSSNTVLTLTTDENALGAVFGESLNAVMKLAKWKEIKAALADEGITLDEQIAIKFVGADGETFDFDGDGSVTAPTVTINGEGTVGTQVLTNNGTNVGNYVTAYIPEPTTTTLSLLALAALAARRRRR